VERPALTAFAAARIAEAAVGREGWFADRAHQSQRLAERLGLQA